MQNYFKPTGIGVMPKKTKREKELEKSLLMYDIDPEDEFEPHERSESRKRRKKSKTTKSSRGNMGKRVASEIISQI